MGLKVSSCARMILLDYLKQKHLLAKESREDIKLFMERKDDEGEGFEDFVKTL